MQRRKLQITIISIMLVIVLAPLSSGCDSGDSNAEYGSNDPPFYPDRVVEVRLVTIEENWESMLETPLAEEYFRADFWYDGELIPDIAVRTKGNSSLATTAKSESIRYSLKVDLNFFNSSRNLNGVKKLVFNNGFSDPTFMREMLAYEIYAKIGIPSPRTAFVDLWVNNTHLGLYTMVEAIDKTFISNHFTDNAGNLYKPEMPAAYLNWTEEDYENQMARMGASTEKEIDPMDVNLGGGRLSDILAALEAEEDGEPDAPRGMFGIGGGAGIAGQARNDFVEAMGLKTNENKQDHSNLFRLLDVLNNEPDETFAVEIEKVLDVDETLRYLAVSALIVHLDNYIAMGHNYYLYDNNGKFVILPWDLNMAFGTFNFGLDADQLINYYIDEPTGGAMEERPLVERLLSYQPYLEKYHEYLEQLLDGPFSIDVMEARINELADMIRPYVYADETKFFSNQQFERGIYLELTASQTSDTLQQMSRAILNMPALSVQARNCLQEKMPLYRIVVMIQSGPDEKDMEILESCLSEEELTLFLKFLENPQEIPGVPENGSENRVIIQDMPTFGTRIGLVNFIIERHKSVIEQLEGTRVSGPGDGSGNGGSFGGPGNFQQRQENFRPAAGGGQGLR